jgi:hypothetical protein
MILVMGFLRDGHYHVGVSSGDFQSSFQFLGWIVWGPSRQGAVDQYECILDRAAHCELYPSLEGIPNALEQPINV